MSEKQTLQEKHFALVDAVNDARTEIAHRQARDILTGWRKGVEDAGIRLSLLDADYHTADRFGEVDMCCGVLLNWKPEKFKIITRHDPPPIPDRNHDWTAVREGYDQGDPVGHGPTETSAIADLKEQEIGGLP